MSFLLNRFWTTVESKNALMPLERKLKAKLMRKMVTPTWRPTEARF